MLVNKIIKNFNFDPNKQDRKDENQRIDWGVRVLISMANGFG